MLGETIGHYRLTERLGAGAMGEVYLAQDLRLHRPVALKMLPACAAGDEAASARLVQEARVASALNHPNIAVVYEIGEAEREGRRHTFIAMEYVAGHTLADLIPPDGMEPARAIQFGARRGATARETDASADPSSPPDAYRASGFFSSARLTTWRTAGGLRAASSAGASSRTMAASVANTESRRNGCTPLSIS